jgi:hypothetical protein
MYKKITLIVVLAVALAAFLVLRPYIFRKEAPPRIEDRLPEADFIGRAYLLDVARETSGMLYYHKVPLRDFFSYEFILGQSKTYGLNLQEPAYFFANEAGDWGAVIEVSDSSKILQGIERLRKLMDVVDSTMHDKRVYHFPDQNGFMYYDRTYMLLYKGNDFKKIHKRVTDCKHGDISPVWKAFLREKQFRDERLVIYSNWKKLKDNGIETAIFAHDSDSISFSLKAYMRNRTPLNVSMKEPGKSFSSAGYTNKMLNVHLDVSNLREHPEDPLYQLMINMGRKISFPTAEFLNVWEGDLSFRQGGFQTIIETYVESELDENFNVTEVRKEKEVKVPGFSLMFSVNEKGPRFIQRLQNKGILTTDENGAHRFLFSPPLQMKKVKNYYVFHSGQYTPRQEISNSNNGVWTQRGTRIEFSLDSLSKYEAYGSLYIPVNRIISRNRFF